MHVAMNLVAGNTEPGMKYLMKEISMMQIGLVLTNSHTIILGFFCAAYRDCDRKLSSKLRKNGNNTDNTFSQIDLHKLHKSILIILKITIFQ